MREVKNPNNKERLKAKLLKIFSATYLISIYLLLLNSLWYFIRLFVFDRRVEISMVEIEHSLEFIFFISSLIALYRCYKMNVRITFLNIFLRILFISFSFLGVFMTINKTYFDISPAVMHKWESGEWTF